MLYVDNVRNYTKDMPIEEAVDNSIAQVWQRGLIVEHRAYTDE